MPLLKQLQNKKLILASASPRRKEILSLLNIPFEVMPADIEEKISGLSDVVPLAVEKADYIFQNTEVSGLRFIYPELRTVVMTRQLLASSSPSTLDKSKARSPPAKGMTHIPCGPA